MEFVSVRRLLKYLFLHDGLSLVVAIFNHLPHVVELLLENPTSSLHRLQLQGIVCVHKKPI